MTRRELIQLAGGALLAAGAYAAEQPEPPPPLHLERRKDGNLWRFTLRNTGSAPVAVKEVVLFSLKLDLPPETHLYGESFQMLSQTGGTLGSPVDLGYSERKHYRIPQPEDATALTGMVTLTPPGGETRLMAFTSCRRFAGRFFLRPGHIDVVIDTENLELGPGESWELEEYISAQGAKRAALLDELAKRINVNHPPLAFPKPPAGWCSWYCFGPEVTAEQVLANLDFIAKNIPALKYVQIDDGYQSAMGDWLSTGKAFGGDLVGVLKKIRARGFEPAIWVAPFIAEENSQVFREHPDWFVKDAAGKPLRSSDVTFGGWRHGPWYAIDGTHPEAQKHLEQVFRTMRREWGCTYFKLDANFWGAIHGGHFHDPKATRIEAYRRGMQAVLRGAGDSFILGCNHPVWASFGGIPGSRRSADISRDWKEISETARQNLNRNWQNGRLWWNDPDAVVFSGKLPLNEYKFHAAAILAAGGLVLSGDDLTQLPPDRLAMLRKLLPPSGKAAAFDDDTLRVGRLGNKTLVFNWTDQPQTIKVDGREVSLPGRSVSVRG
jgi:alpha-galactosidase